MVLKWVRAVWGWSFLFILAVIPLAKLASREFTNEQLGSTYYAYPGQAGKLTPVPDGYIPFYISHYGRHGSRWITSEDRYTRVLDVFKEQKLTPLGEDVKQRLYQVWEDAKGRAGDLTPLGERQHKRIAERMYTNYPQVFQGEAAVSARSSTSVRCIMSMCAFSERLKELNVGLRITREANSRYMDYLAYTSLETEALHSDTAVWRTGFRAFEATHIKPQRLMKSLFKHPEKITDSYNIMMDLYWIASDMQNVELSLSFYDIFEKEELVGIWRCINYRMYVCNAASPLNQGIPAYSAVSLLKNIVESADEAINNQSFSATLRFGHDTNLIRLLTLMEIEECSNQETDPERFHLAWQDFRISPMAANLQIIFFKNGEDIMVKFLHNENEVKLPIRSSITPYYKWQDVRSFFMKKL